MRGIVINNQMQVQVRRCLRVDLFEKNDLLLVTMPWQAFRNDLAFGQLDCGE